jgi:uncharacterized integral membrane protein
VTGAASPCTRHDLHGGLDVTDDDRIRERPMPAPGRKISPTLIAGAVIAVVLLIFIVQNSDRVDVTWLVFNRRAPVWLVILISAVLGYFLGEFIATAIRRRRTRE